MRRIALTVQYDGTDYAGFQLQPHQRTIQGELQAALSELLQHQVRIIGAGRTDAGVHAMGQVVSLQTDNPIPDENLLRATNNVLPASIVLTRCATVTDAFHPCYDAVAKLYSYKIVNRRLRSPFLNRYAWLVPGPLDGEAMSAGAEALIGEHDFTSFAAAGRTTETTVREVFGVRVERDGDLLTIWAAGSGFLYMMVRIIVGTLVEVGKGALDVSDVARILECRDRSQAGPTAPPHGLCLVKVEYQAGSY